MAKCTMNAVFLHGRLATEAELKETKTGKKRTSFLIAVDRIGHDDSDFFRVILWEKQAELASQFLKKGNPVILQGSLRSWKNDQGQLQVEIQGRHITFPSKAETNRQQETQTKEPDTTFRKDEVDNIMENNDVPF